MKKDLSLAVIWACIMLGAAFAARYAHARGYIDEDVMRRVVACLIGLWFAYYGNRLPKSFVPNACARKARRFAGWAMVLSGLAYTGLWIFAPIPTAVTLGTAAILGSIALTFLYCLSLRGGRPAAA